MDTARDAVAPEGGVMRQTGQEVLQIVDDFASLLSRKAEMDVDTIRRRDQVGTVTAVETALANEAMVWPF